MAARRAATAMETIILWQLAAYLAVRLAANSRIQNTKNNASVKFIDLLQLVDFIINFNNLYLYIVYN